MKPCKDHCRPGSGFGYGVVRHEGRTQLEHRLVYCREHGLRIQEIAGKVVRHSCDNPRCIEPSHLLLGTQADNVRDMMTRNRQRYSPLPKHVGASNVNAKLDDAKVVQIRDQASRGEKQKAIARRFGISQSLVSMVVNKKFWRHVA